MHSEDSKRESERVVDVNLDATFEERTLHIVEDKRIEENRGNDVDNADDYVDDSFKDVAEDNNHRNCDNKQGI